MGLETLLVVDLRELELSNDPQTTFFVQAGG